MENTKKEKPEQNQHIPDALGKDELQNKDLRRATEANKHDIYVGDGEVIESKEGPDNSLKENDTPPFQKGSNESESSE